MASKHTIRLDNGKGLILAVDSVQNISEVFSAKATNLPTADKKSVSDHAIKDNPKFTLNGIISGVYNPKDPRLNSPETLTESYRKAVENASLVEFTSGDRTFKNCHVDTVNLSRDIEVGKTGWRISLNLTQIRIASGGKDSVISVNANVTDQAANKQNVSSSSTKEVCKVLEVEGLGAVSGKNTYGSVCGN